MAEAAAARASVYGLEGLSIGALAGDLGISKGGVQAVFSTKQTLQLATVQAATEIFVQRVVRPAQDHPPGLARLWALIDAWLAYVEGRVFPGGCFMAATVPEHDSRPGPVRAALASNRKAWLGLLQEQIEQARAAGELADDVPSELLAFEIDAVLTMANNARNLADDTAPLDAARALLRIRLAGAPARRRRASGPA